MNKLLKLLTADTAPMTVPQQTPSGLLTALLVSLVLAGVMMVIYRICHDSLTYDRKFNIMLMMLALASTLLLTLIQNNPLFSLGALGALSICRIRANTRDPRDLGFVFWSLSIGISAALGEYFIGAAGTALIGLVMVAFGRSARQKEASTMVVRGRKDAVGQVQAVFSETPGSVVQSKSVSADSFELVYQLHVSKIVEDRLLLDINNMEGIQGVNILAPQTQVT